MSDAATRLRDWNDGADDVPTTYTYDALEFQQDLRTVLAERDAALAEVKRLREALAYWLHDDEVRDFGEWFEGGCKIARAAPAKEADSDR